MVSLRVNFSDGRFSKGENYDLTFLKEKSKSKKKQTIDEEDDISVTFYVFRV